ncbi:GGDEF domain-containing protein [Pigmentiphaga litoralis]|uniref:diguanylate cyclase n=1 Tax=Pigmentiphaga litoralis TaxID=516702 RepID=A0A7Y9IZ95_9BURK|nr:GGDEF domain-containing protein [Pigmentiphaga litoralis]NYE26811.1 diguanylate cyclase (GGDEF)-like protein [Pigmentiphaga litoralis]NYE85779.1 diguanylate cyclase (GGDEF)-like protein [Pigmentiphaga litoralis]
MLHGLEGQENQERWRVRGEVRTLRQVRLRTLLGTLGIVVIADLVDLIANLIFAPWQIVRSAIQTTLISGPLAGYVIYTHARANLRLYEMKTYLALLSTTDPLTGLLNRRAFFDRARAVAESRQPHMLVLVDVDRFKTVNDRFGHPAGDAVIQRVSRLMQAHFHANAPLARIGGEEFSAMLLTGTLDEVRASADAFCTAVATEPFEAAGGVFQVTVSVGMAPFAPDRTADEVYALADVQLYRAKQDGGNRVVWEGRQVAPIRVASIQQAC